MKNQKRDYELEDNLIRVWSTYLPESTPKEVEKVLRSKWINTGKKAKELGETLRNKFKFPSCVLCNSGTSALRASLAAIGVGHGDEVVSTPYTFIATNTSILEQGAKPVFADIKYETLNIDPDSIIEKITDKTKAIICVHYGGVPCDMDEIRKIGIEYNLPIIEDSAHALGSKYKGKYIGEEGDFITFSMQVVKIVTSGDGGIIATTNEDYYNKLKKLVWYGVDREAKKTDILDPLSSDIDMLGFKYNMNDITATMGLEGIKDFEKPLAIRKRIGELYRKELSGLSKIKLIDYNKNITPNYQIFPIHVENRLKFAQYMRGEQIMVNVNNRRNDKYSIFGGKCDLPVTEKVDNDTILIPLHTDLIDNDVEKIINTIKKYDSK